MHAKEAMESRDGDNLEEKSEVKRHSHKAPENLLRAERSSEKTSDRQSA